jgi:hypothetical protein
LVAPGEGGHRRTRAHRDERGCASPPTSILPDQYRVFSVENILSGEGASPARWRIGFKRRALVPDQVGGWSGKGGEVYIEVDASTRQAQRGKGGD